METISPTGLPKSLDFENLPSLPDSARSYDISVSPSGNTSVSVQYAVASLFTQNAIGATANFSSQLLTFDIPCGMNPNIFMDTKETMLCGRFSITTTATMTGAVPTAYLNSSFASFFNSLVLYCNNTPVEQIFRYDLLFNMLLMSCVNDSERSGGLGINLGCNDVNTQGINLSAFFLTAGTYYFNFSIPLISIIGLNTSSVSGKLLPIGSINNLQLQMETAGTLPITTSTTNTAIAGATTYTLGLDQFYLNMKYVDLGDIGGNMLRSSLRNGRYFIKSQTYSNSNVSLPTGSFGNQSLSLQIRNSSVKSLIWFFAGSRGLTTNVNGLYDAVNAGLSSVQATIGGAKFPQRAMNPTDRPAECYSYFQQAFGASSLKSFGGVINSTSYNGYLGTLANLPSTRDGRITAVASATALTSPYKHFEGLDLEKVSGSLLSGINTRSQPPILDTTISVATGTTLNCFAWGLIDVILEIDPQTRVLTTMV